MRILGLHGEPGVGKDTTADILVAEHGFIKRAFATPLYEEVANAHDVTVDFLANRETKESELPDLALMHCRDQDFVALILASEQAEGRAELDILEKPRSPRWALNHWGTEFRLGQDPDCWINLMRDFIQTCRDSGVESLVVTDVRPPPEAMFIRSQGVIWHVLGGGHLQSVKAARGTSHKTTRRLSIEAEDRVIHNDGDLAGLAQKIREELAPLKTKHAPRL